MRWLLALLLVFGVFFALAVVFVRLANQSRPGGGDAVPAVEFQVDGLPDERFTVFSVPGTDAAVLFHRGQGQRSMIVLEGKGVLK